jgi:hypothetical protein
LEIAMVLALMFYTFYDDRSVLRPMRDPKK